MREIFTHQDYTRVGHFQSLLEAEGIQTFVKNQHSHHIVPEMPSGLFFPTLCVVNDEDYEKAMDLLQPLYDAPEVAGEDWACPQCAQPNPANFEFCWNCKRDKTLVAS